MAELNSTRPRRDHVSAMKTQRAVMARARGIGLSGSQWAVLTSILDLTTSYGRTTDRISREQIADLAGVSVATVRRALDLFRDAGLIEIVVARGRGRSNLITVRSDQKTAHTTHEDEPFSEPEPELPAPQNGSSADDSGDKTAHAPTQIEPLPEREHPGEKAAGPAPVDADDLEGLADAIIAHALEEAGCSWERWKRYPQRDRRRLEDEVDALLRAGCPPHEVFDALAVRSDVDVVHWPGFLASRLFQIGRRAS